MVNRLSTDKRVQILNCLVEGNSLRATARMTGASKNTVTKLLIDAGRACQAYHDEHVRDLVCEHVQCDEIWSFVYAKARNVKGAKAAPEGAGDIWTWTALDRDSKLMISYMVGNRDAEYANAFIQDVADRLATRVQMTTDSHRPYLEAIEGAFGAEVDYAQLVKAYGMPPSEGRYSPAVCVGAKKRRVQGEPDKSKISTSHVERQNLTMRMHMRRFTRLTNAFSKKVENLAHAVALHFMYYNFVRIHQSLRVTPAMAAGVTDRLWAIEDIVNLIDAAAPKPKKRGPYKRNSK